MNAKEIKERLFGEFINWLNKNGVGDHFSTDVWMSKAWDTLFGEFEFERKREKTKQDVISRFNAGELKEMMELRDRMETAQKNEDERKKKEAADKAAKEGSDLETDKPKEPEKVN